MSVTATIKPLPRPARVYFNCQPAERICEDALLHALHGDDAQECEDCGHLIEPGEERRRHCRTAWGPYVLTVCGRCE